MIFKIINPPITAWPYASGITWSTNLTGSISWTATGGFPAIWTGSTFPWLSPSSQTSVRIQATNGTTTLERLLAITNKAWPEKADVIDGEEDDFVLLRKTEDRSRRGRRISLRKRSYALQFRNRTPAEYANLLTLFETVGKLEPFIMLDPAGTSFLPWYFDSKIGVEFTGGKTCGINYSFRVKEA